MRTLAGASLLANVILLMLYADSLDRPQPKRLARMPPTDKVCFFVQQRSSELELVREIDHTHKSNFVLVQFGWLQIYRLQLQQESLL